MKRFIPLLGFVYLLPQTIQAAALAACLDEYADRLGVTALPDSASAAYKTHFCQYTAVDTDNGPIEIFGGSQLSSLQLYRARSILEFYLQNFNCTEQTQCYGRDKQAIRLSMASNHARLDMPNGAHEQPGAGMSLQGQELFWAEMPVEGDAWFMNNDWDHRDAAMEEILHLVHDAGVGVDGANTMPGALPAFQKEIRNATNINSPTYLGGNGVWAEDAKDWIQELAAENSLSQEYLASVIDVYYGLWGAFDEPGGMWGLYQAQNREALKTVDPSGYQLVQQFFSPYFTWMAALSPALEGTFSMTFDESMPYTWKSQYYLHATLLGGEDSNLIGNDQDNCLAPNSGKNSIDGKEGTDVVLFRGSCEEYTIECDSSQNCIVLDQQSDRDGVTDTSSIEVMAFADGDYDIEAGQCGSNHSVESELCLALVPPGFYEIEKEPKMEDVSDESKGRVVWKGPLWGVILLAGSSISNFL